MTARLGSVDKRRGHALLLSLDLSQSTMRLSWMLELNLIISMYLTIIIIVLLRSIMATIIMLMLVRLTAMIIMFIAMTVASEKYGILDLIWGSLAFITLSQLTVVYLTIVALSDFCWWGKGHVMSHGFKGLNYICEVNLSIEITHKRIISYIIFCL